MLDLNTSMIFALNYFTRELILTQMCKQISVVLDSTILKTKFSKITHSFEPIFKKVEVKTNVFTTKAIFASLFVLFCGQSVFSRIETVVRCEDGPVYPSDTQLSDCLKTEPAVIYLVSPIVIVFLSVLNFIPEKVYELRRGSHGLGWSIWFRKYP